MKMYKKALTQKLPKVDSSPRITQTGKSFIYEFRNLKDLRSCLEDGTFIFIVKAAPGSKFAEDKKINLSLEGCHSDREAGAIYVGASKDYLEERAGAGTQPGSLIYPLLSKSAPNYHELKNIEDTEEDLTVILTALGEEFHEIRERYLPTYSGSVHYPNKIKCTIPKPNEIKLHNKGQQVEVIIEQFDLSNYIQAEGKILFKLSYPWFMINQTKENILMGCTFSLARWKYLTDMEKKAVNDKKEKAKRLQDEEEEEKRAVRGSSKKTKINLENED